MDAIFSWLTLNINYDNSIIVIFVIKYINQFQIKY